MGLAMREHKVRRLSVASIRWSSLFVLFLQYVCLGNMVWAGCEVVWKRTARERDARSVYWERGAWFVYFAVFCSGVGDSGVQGSMEQKEQ
ncbi:hypothetical protein B0T18DRAFT_182610 [Schizothecium vesticola]|uniref:Uncharacterized protein n=1 Tax=Schizothecium vesticola TaxID=314040 RepID=A0AA40EQ00_9PEZI|nr:hypothetical protein B0T18DRAFT_182610 [Schizothecium vesticola]